MLQITHCCTVKASRVKGVNIAIFSFSRLTGGFRDFCIFLLSKIEFRWLSGLDAHQNRYQNARLCCRGFDSF